MSLSQPVASLLEALDAASIRLSNTAAGLSDADVAAPSALPGWTRAHVLAHLARNADTHRGMAAGAARGQLVQQYAGGHEQRARDIEAGARGPAADLRADVPRTAEALSRAWHAMPEGAWSNLIGRTTGPAEAWQGLQARLLEVEVHHADLAAGYSWRDWPPLFADHELDAAASRIARAAAASPDGLWLVARDDRPGEWPIGQGDRRGRISGPGTALLAWLLGRTDAGDAGLTINGDWARGAGLPRHYPYG